MTPVTWNDERQLYSQVTTIFALGFFLQDCLSSRIGWQEKNKAEHISDFGLYTGVKSDHVHEEGTCNGALTVQLL